MLESKTTAKWLISLGIVLGVVACEPQADESDQGPDEDLTIVVEADKSRILEEEKSLQQKRQSFQSERERLSKEREDLASKLASLSKKDRKQRNQLEQEQQRVEKEEEKLRARMRNFDAERSKLENDKTQLLQRISRLTQTKGGLTIGEREERIAIREEQVKEREQGLSKRESDLTKRQEEAASLIRELKNMLERGVKAPVAVAAPSHSNSQATRAQVLRLQRKVDNKMDRKGVLDEDLPPTARSQKQAAKEAISSKDYGVAHDALEKVEQTIDDININQAFVKAKFDRINRAYQGKGGNKKIDGLLEEVSEAFSDGHMDRANKTINRIARELNKG